MDRQNLNIRLNVYKIRLQRTKNQQEYIEVTSSIIEDIVHSYLRNEYTLDDALYLLEKLDTSIEKTGEYITFGVESLSETSIIKGSIKISYDSSDAISKLASERADKISKSKGFKPR